MTERIKLTMSLPDILQELSEGNPGALTVLLKLMKQAPVIDPEAWAKELQPLLSLDTHGIYGSQIWVFYKDICGESILNMLIVFRAVQLGLMREDTLQAWLRAPHRVPASQFEVLRELLKEKLPSFNKQEVA